MKRISNSIKNSILGTPKFHRRRSSRDSSNGELGRFLFSALELKKDQIILECKILHQQIPKNEAGSKMFGTRLEILTAFLHFTSKQTTFRGLKIVLSRLKARKNLNLNRN